MAGDSARIIHITFGDSAAGSLRRAIAQLRKEEEVFGLVDDLGFGPINPPSRELRGKWIEDVLGYDDFEAFGHRADKFWTETFKPGMVPTTWFSR